MWFENMWEAAILDFSNASLGDFLPFHIIDVFHCIIAIKKHIY